MIYGRHVAYLFGRYGNVDTPLAPLVKQSPGSELRGCQKAEVTATDVPPVSAFHRTTQGVGIVNLANIIQTSRGLCRMAANIHVHAAYIATETGSKR